MSMVFNSKSQVYFVKLIKMKLIVVAIFVFLAISAHAENFDDWEEIDWSKVVPVQELPGFWDGREVKELLQPIAPTRAARIAGGQVVVPHTHPYQAGLLSVFPTGTGLCGGSIFTVQRIITAAHCIMGSSSTQVIIGAHQLTTVEPTQQRRTVQSLEYRIHENYNPSNFHNDIAVLRMPFQFTFTEQAHQIIRALGTAPDFEGSMAQITGWGNTADGSGNSLLLRSTTNNVISNLACQSTHGNNVFSSTICTSTTGGRGICQGKNNFLFFSNSYVYY
jgi:chymotrypsin